ncbi:uncharacterized protein MELLADRAFT_92653 [Melampsora larici-populina 98AG31]|uniref:Uncharacterized protein n=1 Tax=Melampsora larici-populina (strain 98AG31 / pathotype 3-4-7) TaxID=747676 RepID=F4S2B5_MELLP|nr:uncharacterized protein MELLADRAFT_92653 [Melampsora larici-populina 98AG31]EGG01233.1 hypothetical protein MELLADRAFT_92653 [Melampsora larici-populina 98AG31]
MVFLINLEFNWALRLNKKKIKGEIDDKKSNEKKSFLARGLELVLVYWFTSNSFSIIQSICFDLIDKREINKKSMGGLDLMKPKSIEKVP